MLLYFGFPERLYPVSHPQQTPLYQLIQYSNVSVITTTPYCELPWRCDINTDMTILVATVTIKVALTWFWFLPLEND